MTEELNLGNILKNAIVQEQKVSTEHILSNISLSDVLSLSDETNTLKIETSSNDIFSLDLTSWKKVSSNDEEGLATFTSLSNESVKILIDENIVNPI